MKSIRLSILAATVAAVALYLALVDAVRLSPASPRPKDEDPDERDDAESFAEEFGRMVNCNSSVTYGTWERPS